tara:strand:+ start:749 stop:1273 length:525 start_codon:yes stop_codon:yes gene_type:complete
MKQFITLLAVSLALPSSASTFNDHVGPMIEYESFEMQCLAMNVYHEARSENLAGKYAVADVVLNRVRDDRYPNSICGVVYQGEHKPSWKDPQVLVPKRNRCQFSWYCDGRSDEATEEDAWEESFGIAFKILENNRFRGITEGATHYHTTFVDPYWAPTLQQVGTIGSHIFYRAD